MIGVGAEQGIFGSGTLLGGRYRVSALIGRGATSDVYAVLDESTFASLALKYQCKGNKALLEREYYTLCELAHPSIIAVHEYATEGEHGFYTMELLEGHDLAKRGPLPWREACEILRDVVSSLAILHSRGLLHRDLSARNVFRTRDGRAKLIDFGAMTPMGVAKQLIGTPPFVPPEALQLQALDARADLYALGALAYYVLTGKHAYLARTFEQLPDTWRTPPRSVRALAPDVPEALDTLVLELLSLDRSARPSLAGAVMERICGIAALPLREGAEVTHAYLTMPALVGRKEQLQAVRAALLGLRESHGSTIAVRGAEGTGRSRFLDACVLEAKLLGATVVRADAADAQHGEYGVVRALCTRLFAALPEVAQKHARPHAAVITHLLPMLSALPDSAPDAALHATAEFITEVASDAVSELVPERRHTHAALRDFLLSLSRRQRIVIAVDDFDVIDEPSAALLAALANGAQRRSLVLLLALDRAAETTPALSLVQEVALDVLLEPLDAAQTEQLLRGVFGDTDHVAPVATRIYEISEGSPRATMALAEHLVTGGVARYEAGQWILPPELAAGDLPESIAGALLQRLTGLSTDARSLAEALALTDAGAVPVERYAALSFHGDSARAYRALDALIAARVLVSSGGRYRFAQRELSRLLVSKLSRERVTALHGRLAALLSVADEPVLIARHLWFAGREHDAIELVLKLREDPKIGFPVPLLELLERCIEAGDRLKLPFAKRVDLSMGLLSIASARGDDARLRRHGGPLLERFKRESGLADYEALTAVPADQRLGEALKRTQQRYDATPESERGLPPIDAIKQLARLCATYAGITSVINDLELIESLPSLEPLAPLSAALGLVCTLVASTIDFQRARFDDSAAKSLQIIERVSQPDRGGLDPSFHRAMYLGQLFLQGVLAAARGQATTPAWLAELEQHSGHRVNAWRVRMTHELMQGDFEAARISRRNAELLQLQDGGHQMYPGATTRIELLAYTLAADVLGVKRVMTRIEAQAAAYPRSGPLAAAARARYRSLQGDIEGALEALKPGLEIKPGRHIDWPVVAGTHLALLIASGRAREAVELGLSHIETCRIHRLSPSHRTITRLTADAMVAAGRYEEAKALAIELLEDCEANGVRGVSLTPVCEALARAAMGLGDRAVFAQAAERYDRESALCPVLRPRYDRLIAEAAALGVCDSAIEDSSAVAIRGTAIAMRALQNRLAQCDDAARRAQIVLAALIEATNASAGYLFGMRMGALEVIAQSEAHAPEQAILELVEARLRSETAAHQAATAGANGTEIAARAAAQISTEDVSTVASSSRRSLPPSQMAVVPKLQREVLVLVGPREGDSAIAALAALDFKVAQSEAPRALIELLAVALLEKDDVDPVTRVA